jgi:hypothetical protein
MIFKILRYKIPRKLSSLRSPYIVTVLKFKRNAYTEGIVNCLLQPGHFRNQLHKSMLEASFHLLNLVYPDSSCYRDKVSRAAGRRVRRPPVGGGEAFFALRL